jgi:hypothetical protein
VLVQQDKLAVTGYTMRALDSTGTRITLTGAPLEGTLVPQQLLDQTLGKAGQRASGVTFKGIVTVEATATPAQLRQLLADERVFTTDVGGAIATERARAKLVAGNAAVAQLPVQTRLAAPLYWYMENTGVAQR